MTALVAYSPQLYQWFCSATGYGGAVRRAVAPVATASASESNADEITVIFDSNVSKDLPWEFKPEQRRIKVKFGVPTQVYYDAKNLSDQTIVARAVYNVSPDEIAPYFFKIQCFCFTNEKLKPGESARMPLVFYIDREAEKDKDAKTVDEVTLSYTFYPQNGLTPQEVAQTRDLGTGSAEKDAQIKRDGSADFENDAPGTGR